MLPEAKGQAHNRRFKVRNWTESFWRLLFPPRCLTCEALLPPPRRIPLCRSCHDLFSLAGLICPRCGHVCAFRQPCDCTVDAIPLRGLFALSWYEGAWRRMLHRFKFEGRRGLARPLGHWLGRMIAEQTDWMPDLAVPVPLHRSRLAERGYDQAYLLARFTAQSLCIPFLPLLVKTRASPPQSSLSYMQRKVNIEGAFSYRGALIKPGETVLLVDDIYSTGSTMQEAAKVLHERGLIVFGAAAAFTPHLF